MDTERMTILDLNVLQPARSMVQLALDHYKSDDLFQQLLSFDSALDALDEIIDRLKEELEDMSNFLSESSPEYRARNNELWDIFHFTSKIEGLQKIVRTNFNQRARKLRGSSILRFPYDFPDELLLKIVNCFESNFDETTLRFDSEHPVNIRTIRNLRLTCRRLCDISSPFLVPYIHVTPSVSSLNHVHRVTSHPTISRGLQRIFVNMAVLVAEHAKNFQSFAYNRHNTLDKIEQFYDSRIVFGMCGFGEKSPAFYAYQGFGMAVSGVSRIFESLIPTFYEEPPDDDYDYDPDAFDSTELDLDPDLYDEMKDGLDESQISLWEMLQREHARYRELYEEQTQILRTGQLTRCVAAAAARSRLNLSVYMSDEHKDPIHGDPFGLRQALREHGDRDVDHDFVIRLCGMREGQQWEWGDLSEAPQSVLYELPLAISAAGANLTELVIDTTAIFSDSRPALDMTQEQIAAVEHASRSLKTLVFEVDDSDERKSLLRYLSALMKSQTVTNLNLDLGCINRRQRNFIAEHLRPPNPSPPSSPCAVGPLGILEPWNNLQNLSLKRYSLDLNELEQLLSVLNPEVRIALKQITLLSGTWAEALHRLGLKNGAGRFIEIADAYGSETDSMHHRLYRLMFRHSEYFTNWATRFIWTGAAWGARNPLHHMAELTEMLKKVPMGGQQFDRDLYNVYTAFQQKALKDVQIN